MELQSQAGGPLLEELQVRLRGEPGPRLLIDGLWFSRPHGGITRVWRQILATWQLPGLLYPAAPVALIDRDSHLGLTSAFEELEGAAVDPLDPEAVVGLAEENGRMVQQWQADVFCSSWISSSGSELPACPELALLAQARRAAA